MAVKRSTAVRDRHRAEIRSQGGPCHICGGAIDYDLPYLHPLSFVVDHVIPINKGGDDRLENKAGSHRACNRAKSDKLPAELQPRIAPLTTERNWW